MRIVLLKSPHPGQPAQSATGLVSVKNAEICKAKGQFLVTSVLIPKYQHVVAKVDLLDLHDAGTSSHVLKMLVSGCLYRQAHERKYLGNSLA